MFASETAGRPPFDRFPRNIIPQPLKAEVQVHLVPSEEITRVLSDVHNDRELYFWGFLLLLFMLLCIVVKYMFSKSKKD